MSQTGEEPDPIEVEETVKTALGLGYRHIDCAPVYDNEIAVGKGIAASEIPRSELFVSVSVLSAIGICLGWHGLDRSQASCGTQNTTQKTLVQPLTKAWKILV